MACGVEDTDRLTTPFELTAEKAASDSVAMHCLALEYHITNFTKWKAAFDQGESLGKSFGLQSMYVFRKAPDTNMVLVIMKVADIEKAIAYKSDPTVVAASKKMGVIDLLSFKILNAVHLVVKSDNPDCILLQHEVEDYKAWVKGFDEAMATNNREGVRAFCRFSVLNNPTMVSVLMEVKSFELAKRIVSSAENISARKQSGAISEPIITLLTYIK